MIALIYVITELVDLILGLLLLFMFVRMVISFFPMDDDSPIIGFIFSVTEPIIFPIRALFSHFGWFEGVPIDIAFLTAVILLSFLRNML